MRAPALAIPCVLLGTILGGCSGAPATPGKWIGTWATAPQAAMPGTLEIFQNQQLRLIVHTSIGGREVRIRLSNLYGSVPLQIGAARIARRLHDADIDASSERPLMFSGQSSARIAPGASLTSDAVSFDVPPFADLAITLFLPGAVEATTSHLLAQQTSYVSASAKGAADGFVANKTIDTWPFLTGVDVLAQAEAASVVVFGDSTVDGDGSTSNTNRRWPDYLAHRLNAAQVAGGYGVLNLGIIGNRLLHDSPGAGSAFGEALGAAGLARFERDALMQPGVACVIVRLGVNDLGFPGAFTGAAEQVTAAQLIDAYTRLARAAHARQVRVIATTIAPFEGTAIVAGYHSAAKEQARTEINVWLRQGGTFDGLIDADAALRDPVQPSRLLAEYDSGDHLHPGDAGNEHLAAAMPVNVCRE